MIVDNFKLRFLIFNTILLFILSSSLSCHDNVNEEIKQEEKFIIDVRTAKDPIKLNPILIPSSYSKLVFQYIMPQLCDFNPFTLAFEPILLKSIPTRRLITTGKYKGKTAIQMEIKSHAKWDDGSPITANDYIFTVKLAKHPLIKNTSWRLYLELIQDVLINDENNQIFEVIIDGDYYIAMEMVSSLQIFPQYVYDNTHVMDKISIPELNNVETIETIIQEDSLLVQYAKDFNSVKFYKNHVSSFGPYRLEEWETGQYIRLKKKENYWASNDSSFYLQQEPDELVFHIIPDEVNAINQLKNGTIDVLTRISPTSFQQLKKDKLVKEKYQFFSPNTGKRYGIFYNLRDEYLKDINIRKAISHGIDVESLIHTIEYGLAERVATDFRSAKYIYDKSLVPYKFDLQLSKEYLKKSGWIDHDKNGFVDKKINGSYEDLTMEYLATTSKKSQNIAILVKESLQKSGIKLEIKIKEFRQIRSQELKNFNFDMLMRSSSPDVPPTDPYPNWHSDNIDQGETNFSGYSNEKADQVIEEIRITIDKNKLQKLYFELERLLYDNYTFVPLYELTEQIVLPKSYEATSFSKRPGYLLNTFKQK